jgi:hypothetical protein
MKKFRDRRLDKLLYGWTHQKTRRAMLPYATSQLCTRCKKPIEAGQAIDLDHYENSLQYRGWAHASCNRAEGGRHSQAQAARRDPEPKGLTKW